MACRDRPGEAEEAPFLAHRRCAQELHLAARRAAVLAEHLLKVPLAEDDDVIDALAPDRSRQKSLHALSL